MGIESFPNFTNYHRVLNRAQWNGLSLAKILLGLLIKALPPSWPILIAVDETIERRSGRAIKAKGIYRDAARSSKKLGTVKTFGLKWECMTLIVPLPWCKRPWALPFLTILAPSKKANEKAGRRHKTSLDWTAQMVRLVSRWLGRPWILVGDGTYACIELAHQCCRSNVALVSRLRLDAQLFDFPVYKKKGRKGRTPIKGVPIKLRNCLEDSNQLWCSDTLDWYGGEKRQVEYFTLECLWYNSRSAPVTCRIVLIRTPGNTKLADVFFSTDTRMRAEQIIAHYIMRWNIEVTFEETRAHLGFETQRQWSDKAIARTTPLILALFSIGTLVALNMNQVSPLSSMNNAIWYDKQNELTFSDIIALLRRAIWSQKYFSTSSKKADTSKWTDNDINTLIYQLSIAA